MNTNDQVSQILIISTSERGSELQNAIHESLNTPVAVVGTFKEALAAVALSPYKAVILDEGLADLDPKGADHFLERCQDELPIFVKLAITGVVRCVQQVQLAIRRFDREQRIVAISAQCSIGSQLRDALTSVLIHSQLALNTPGMPQDAIKHIKSVLEAVDVLQKAIVSETGLNNAGIRNGPLS
jgi:hypothetical protein